MIAVDTSVVVAAFASWHMHHAQAARVMVDSPRLLAPSALESYAVLTRLPPPHRAEAPIVREFLGRAFSPDWLALPTDGWTDALERLVRAGISGGASYDAIIAMTAGHHGHELLTLDRRAQATYERIGTTARFIG